jgi:hypothetical protein
MTVFGNMRFGLLANLNTRRLSLILGYLFRLRAR